MDISDMRIFRTYQYTYKDLCENFSVLSKEKCRHFIQSKVFFFIRKKNVLHNYAGFFCLRLSCEKGVSI